MKPVCLITGSGGLLGNALCNKLVDNYDIIAIYRKSIPRHPSQLIQPITQAISSDSNKDNINRIFCIQADLTKNDDIKRLTEVSLAKFGRIDSIINSAADLKFHSKLLELSQIDDYALPQINLNSIIPFQLISIIYNNCWKNYPKENELWNRNVINISSMSGLHVYPNSNQAIYSASKAALNILTLHLATELAPYLVRANAICPPKFTNVVSTNKIVSVVEKTLEGRLSGKIISNFPD